MPISRAALLGAALAAAVLALAQATRAASGDRAATHQDAFVEFDRAANRWIIGNDLVRYSIQLERPGTVRLAALSIGATPDAVNATSEPDALVTIGGETTSLGGPDGWFTLERADASTGTHFVSLALRFVARERGLAATRRYVAYPGVPIVEMWTELETLDGERRTVQNLNALNVAVPPGPIDYVLGLQGPVAEGGTFTRRSRSLADGERLELGSPTLATEWAMPAVSIGNGHQRVVAGLVWSGGWSAALDRRGEALYLTLGLPAMSAWADPGRPIEGPHAFIGAMWDVPGADVAALTRFVQAGRASRPFPAWTAFNTWFVRGIRIDEANARSDIDQAAEIGLELFQLDAGWYPSDRPAHIFDFTDGLGSWQVDRERFPSGLAALAAYARDRGLKFGIWVEPERVGLNTIGRAGGADERFLATQNGAYRPGVPNAESPDAQICLADAAARAWVLERVTEFIAQVGPDNVKWDFNRWIHCNRPDHDHPADGGNFEHTRGLYAILAAVRERFPALTLENSSGGGHRLDFAMARLTDTAWMDDRTAPSAHVRRNLQGLMTLFPAPYLFSYVMAHADEPIRGADDVALLVRSRMPGVVGVAADLGQLSEGERNQLHQEVERAKALRPLQATAITHVLTGQRPGPGEWEVVQQIVPETGLILVFAYAYGVEAPTTVALRGVQPEVTYEVRSSDRGRLGRVSGADLIAGGLQIFSAAESAAQLIVLEPIGTAPSSARARRP